MSCLNFLLWDFTLSITLHGARSVQVGYVSWFFRLSESRSLSIGRIAEGGANHKPRKDLISNKKPVCTESSEKKQHVSSWPEKPFVGYFCLDIFMPAMGKVKYIYGFQYMYFIIL